MKIKNKSLNIIIKIVFVIFVLITILNINIFAEAKFFTMKVPEGYLVAEETTGETKLIAIRSDNKLNFNIQVFPSEEYYEYSDESLKELIKIASTDMTQYAIGTVTGEISKINKYPCYELNYEITAKNTNKKMHIRQIYLYEDTYSYTITIGGENIELVKSREIEDSLNSFELIKYKRNNVKVLTEEEKEEINKKEILKENNFKAGFLRLIENFKQKDIKTQILVIISVILTILLIMFLIIKLIKKRKTSSKNKKKNKDKNK